MLRRLSTEPPVAAAREPLLERAQGQGELIPGFGSMEEAHRTLGADETRGKRVVIIGDVHGCADELEELLDKLDFAAEEDLAVFAGDLIAKGPDSRRAVEIARRIGARAVRGNHDHYAILRLTDDLFPEREHTRLAKKELGADNMDWLKAHPLTWFIEEHNVLVVHAGLLPGTKREANSLQDLLHMRNVEPTDAGGLKAVGGEGKAWAEVWAGPEHVVFGHDAKRKLQQTAHATGLDSGCVYGGHLSALVLPGREIVSVAAHKVHQEPGKKQAKQS